MGRPRAKEGKARGAERSSSSSSLVMQSLAGAHLVCKFTEVWPLSSLSTSHPFSAAPPPALFYAFFSPPQCAVVSSRPYLCCTAAEPHRERERENVIPNETLYSQNFSRGATPVILDGEVRPVMPVLGECWHFSLIHILIHATLARLLLSSSFDIQPLIIVTMQRLFFFDSNLF